MPFSKIVAALFVFLLAFAAPLGALQFQPDGATQFFVQPDTEVQFRFSLDVENPAGHPIQFGWRLLDAEGNLVKEIDSFTVDSRKMTDTIISLTLPQGFWELENLSAKQRFGIIAQKPFEGERDDFFAVDGALSWLVGNDRLRQDLVRIAARSGIGMIRERVSWSAIEPEEGKFDWEANNRYEKLRNLCKENDVRVLEMFHDAPEWTDRLEKYPGDLTKTAKSWQTIADHWQETWGGIEIWNEPDIFFGSNLPADQYVSVARAAAHGIQRSPRFHWANRMNANKSVIGGVVAHFHPDWLECAAENGLLEFMDAFSFHSYDRAPQMEALVEKYRTFLRKHGHHSMPLWLTECGRPWRRGPDRPPADEDFESAVDIVMKGVEARACGVDRYFPFVYPFYEENDNNFGMTDRLGTPCRSMAAYVQMIGTLSGAHYAGDLELDDERILRARVFRHPDSRDTAVLYTAPGGERFKIKLPAAIKSIESVTGNPVFFTDPDEACKDDEVFVRPGRLYYLGFDKDALEGKINGMTRAYRIRHLDGITELFRHRAKEPAPGNLVLRFLYDKEKNIATTDCYLVTGKMDGMLRLTVRVFFLDTPDEVSERRTSSSYPILARLGDQDLEPRVLMRSPKGFYDVTWAVPPDAARLETGDVQKFHAWIPHTNSDERASRGRRNTAQNRLVVSLRGSATWEGVLSAAQGFTELPVGDLSRWHENAPAICEAALETPAEGDAVWRMTATFQDGDRWVYPRFELPKDADLPEQTGLIVKARCVGSARPGLFLFERGGSGYIVQPAFPSDGDWHVVKLPFSKFQYVGATAPDPNGRLDLDQVDFISLGLNSDATNATLEIQKIALYVQE